MTKLSRVFDFVLSRFIILSLAFIWIRYYVSSAWLSLLYALAATAAISLLSALVFGKSRRRKRLNAEEAKAVEHTMTQFIFSSKEKNLNFFYNILKAQYHTVIMPECLIVENGSTKILVFTFFSHNKMGLEDFTKAYVAASKYAADKIIYFTGGFTPSVADTAARIEDVKVTVLDARETYAFLKEYDTFPESAVSLAKPKKRSAFRGLLSAAFSRRNVKGYLFGAAVMLAGSFFVGYNIYYLVSASVLLAFGLISLFRPQKRGRGESAFKGI